MLLTLALLAPPARALTLVAICSGPWLTDIFPAAEDEVSPETIPALILNSDCAGATEYVVTLAQDAQPPTSATVSADHAGVYWLPGLPLTSDATYVLAASEGDYPELSATLTVGSAPLPALTGTPTISVLGAERAKGQATVSLELTLVDDPTSGIYEISRDGSLVMAGINDTTVIDSFAANNGDSPCYTVTQYLANGTQLGTSEKTCVGVHGCSHSPTLPSTTFYVAAAAMLAARRRMPRRPATRSGGP